MLFFSFSGNVSTVSATQSIGILQKALYSTPKIKCPHDQDSFSKFKSVDDSDKRNSCVSTRVKWQFVISVTLICSSDVTLSGESSVEPLSEPNTQRGLISHHNQVSRVITNYCWLEAMESSAFADKNWDEIKNLKIDEYFLSPLKLCRSAASSICFHWKH